MSAGKVIAGLGAVGAAAGIGYLIWRYVKRRREEAAEEASKAEEHKKAEEAAQEAKSTNEDEPAQSERPGQTSQPSQTGPSEQKPQPADPAPPPAPGLDPLPGPASPLEQPPGVLGYMRINWSHTDDDGTVRESAEVLLEQARKYDATVTMEELTGARLAASEHGSGSFTELACIVDSELNRANRRGMSLFQSLTFEGTFGRQGRKRRASTRQDPTMRHIWAARAVLSGKARGISRGADRFFDPKAMERMNARYRKWVEGGRQGKQPAIVSCDALTLLEVWSFDYGRQGASRCPPDRTQSGRDTLAWVGPIPGVDPLRLMLMKPMKPGQDHTLRHQAARDVLRAGLTAKS